MEERKEVIKVKSLTIKFGEKTLLNNISFNVYENESISLIGPSGCGKTTLLKVIAGVIPSEYGKIYLFDKNISDLSNKEKYWINKETGFLFQNNALFDSYTVLENIIFYLVNHTKTDKNEMKSKAERLLSIVGLNNISNKYPSELSGGMKKRVGLIRAIIHRPSILFLDEPVAGLDPVSADTITKIIKKIKERFNLTLINISNELSYTRKISDRVGILYDGKLYNLDNTEKFFNSDNGLVKQFVNGLKSGPIKY